MNLLFKRSQRRAFLFSLIPLRIGGSVVFKLHAQLEPTEEERALMKRYSFTNATLIHSDVMTDLANAWKPAWFLGSLGIFFAVWGAIQINAELHQFRQLGGLTIAIIRGLLVLAIPLFGLFVALIMCVIYFFALRERISVGQLLYGGRTFYCHSVVELIEKERQLLGLCRDLEATVQASKHWGGREVNPIPEGKPFYRDNESEDDNPNLTSNRLYEGGKVLGTAIEDLKDGVRQYKKDIFADEETSTKSSPESGATKADADSGGSDGVGRKSFSDIENEQDGAANSSKNSKPE